MNPPSKTSLPAAEIGADASDAKAELRREMQRMRAEMGAADREAASKAIRESLWPWLAENYLPVPPGQVLAVYLAGPREPNLDELIQLLLDGGVPLAAPRVDLEAGTMAFWELRDLAAVQSGPWGIRHPPAERMVPRIELALVPALAYDMRGGRLGTGGGWYDRVLPQIRHAVGVCFDFQRLPLVPQEAHDCRVETLFTEKDHWKFVS